MPSLESVDKIDYGQIGPIMLAIFSHFFGGLLIFPFVPFLVKDFLDVSRTDIGFYSGILVSIYHFGVLCGSLLWGTLADRWGRRPAVLLSMSSMLVFMLMFGFSQSFAWAVVARFLWGLSSAVVSLAKTILSESSTNATTARVFSFLGVMGGLGRLTGPAVGGLLSQPAQKFSALDVPFFRQFPYILPVFVAAFVMLVSLIWGFFKLRETLHRASSQPSSANSANGEVGGERIELLDKNDDNENSPDNEENRDDAASKRLGWRCLPINVWCCKPKGGFRRMNDTVSTDEEDTAIASTLCKRLGRGIRNYFAAFGLLRDKVIRHSCVLYGLLAFQAIMHNEVIPLLLVVSFAHGGLCLNSAEIGILTAGFGIGHLLVQLLLYPRLAKRFGYRNVFRGGLCGFFVFILLMPWLANFTGNQDPMVVYDEVKSDAGNSTHGNSSSLLEWQNGTAAQAFRPSLSGGPNSSVPDVCIRHVLSTFNNTLSACGNSEANAAKNITSTSSFQFAVVPCLPYYVWLISLVVVGGGYLTRTVSFTSINVIINNSCEREVRATVNGISMVVSSVGRIAGPLVISNLFAWSVSDTNNYPYPLNHHLTFWIMALICIFTLVWSRGLPASLESRKGSASQSAPNTHSVSISTTPNGASMSSRDLKDGKNDDKEETETGV